MFFLVLAHPGSPGQMAVKTALCVNVIKLINQGQESELARTVTRLVCPQSRAVFLV